MTERREREQGTDNESDQRLRLGAGSFLGEVLGLDDPPDNLAADLSPIKRDSNASIYTIQLDSSVGPAAFLVYAYQVRDRGGDGHTGKELFDAGLDTLEEAARKATPGPRAVAHAETDDFAFILATTPGTYRALTGGRGPTPAISLASTAAPDPPPPETTASDEPLRVRSETAQDLITSLRIANTQASDWLAAVRASERSTGSGSSLDDGTLAFTPDETELALFLLDNESIGTLLRVLNVLVSSAQTQASAVLDDDPRLHRARGE
ncbi:MAG: hypothetical protein AVDCRST_MAG87-890 [uncultured Thermomicrobiales bacterium]|uniref:Uncharacterized protein n=1 Tax=uncultured Thermomicrobiales bacterium TaxID=1645740 RepID=A0A6J4ULP0_9BACT|nr:MAG: hypothetical protein AVDCRST_MAG87-890 [uncultured Thermomicrobiales bacterium]